MANQEDKQDVYTPPTHEELYKSVISPGMYIGRCKKCNQTIKVNTIEEFVQHKCQS